MPYCKSGRHFWSTDEDASKCCNGYVRLWSTQEGPRWVPEEGADEVEEEPQERGPLAHMSPVVRRLLYE